ncbi:MAG: ABC transporter permease [Chloroflexi bacterium]|nr:MAG: ABC transporter permease [Chloroflexota bacterium]
MQELFGVPMTTITVVLLAIFAMVAALVAVLAWRNRIMLKLGIRNIPRRPAQTALIIVGLMLSTVIITSAFGTGDTMVHTIRSLSTRSLGDTDEIVTGGTSVAGSPNYFDQAWFGQIDEALAGDERVDGVLASIRERTPVVDVTTRQNASSVLLFAPDPARASDFTRMTTDQGQVVTLGDLGSDEVYLDKEAADDLRANPGDELRLFLGQQPVTFRLRAVVDDTSAGTTSGVIVMPLSRAQQLLDKEGQINTVHVSNKGGRVDGARYSDEVKAKLEPLLEGTPLEVEMVKQDALDEADEAGSVFTTMFVAFGLFSIAAGLLLIFLIFVLLAAARKPEMGMARAVGTKRHHLVQMFLFEGLVYDLAAALVGVVLGVLVTFAIAGIMARIFQQSPLDLAYHFEPRSLVAAFTLGMLVTFFTVTFSAWRVSRLNIVRAIRDIPEPKLQKAGRRWLVFALLLIVAGFMSSVGGLTAEQASSFHLGISMLIIGLALLMRWFGLSERRTFTLAGIALLVWWLLPIGTLDFLGDLEMGIEMFFMSGMMMVLGAVWVVAFNLDVLLRILTATLGRIRGFAPALRTAIAYPMNNRLRTGLTLAMFSLVIFTIIFMSVTIEANMGVFKKVEMFSGGYDVQGTVNYNNPIPDIEQAVAQSETLNSEDFEAIASQSVLPLEARQTGTPDQEWNDYRVLGVDDVYLETNTYEFAVLGEGYGSAREVWQALKEEPGLAVVSADAVPTKSQFSVSVGGPEFRLEGVYQEDDYMAPIDVEVREPFTGKQASLTVIGVLKPISFNFGLYTSQRTIAQTWAFPIPPSVYLFKLSENVDAEAAAEAIESAFLANGMEARSFEDILNEVGETSSAMNTLLQGFMSLGLVVGIAALGVISTRAVVERRHEIGVLRAIGFQRRTVQLGFLLESSVVALLGVAIGVALALLLSHNVIDFLKGEIEGLEFTIPWVQTLVIAAIAYLAALLMTYLPARQASRIYPAEALRYE